LKQADRKTAGLAKRYVGGASGPIAGSEIDAPKMRRRRIKFDADPVAFLRNIADINHAAFLLFFRHRIDENDIGAKLERFLEIDEPAVRVDDDGLAVLAELFAVGALAGSPHGDAGKHASAATARRGGDFCGHEPIVTRARLRVN
jgi:hypothetical protein